MGCGASTTATAVKTEPVGCDFAEFQACYQKQIGRDLTVAEEKSLRQRFATAQNHVFPTAIALARSAKSVAAFEVVNEAPEDKRARVAAEEAEAARVAAEQQEAARVAAELKKKREAEEQAALEAEAERARERAREAAEQHERDDGAAVRSFLRDASLRAGASIVEVRGPFAHENGSAAFVETGSNEAAQSVSRALDGFRVQEPARCTIRAAPYRLTTSVNAPPPPQRMPQVSAILRSSTVSSSDEGPPVPRRQRVETLTGALDRARGPSAPVLAALDGDLDAAMAQGDSKRCREVEARITRAYSAMLGGLRQLCESGRDDTDVERERGALDAVERALLRGAFRSRDDDESDDEVVLLRGALKAERLRAAALAKEARAHAVRAAALTCVEIKQ